VSSSSDSSKGAGGSSQAGEEISRILAAIGDGDRKASEELLPLVYLELRKLARSRMAHEPPGQTLQPTALVHEAYLRLVGDRDARWENRAHFFAAAALAMRRILVERARRRRMAKHGGGQDRVTLDEAVASSDPRSVDLLALDDALTRLEAHDPRMSRIVTLRYFAGLNVEQTAKALDISAATVKREWSYAKAWLHREIAGAPPSRGTGKPGGR